MREQRSNPLTGRGELTTRRTSLVGLGGLALAALASRASETEAKKNKKNKSKEKCGKRCKKQGNSCREFAAQLCEQRRPPGPVRDACLDRANACCSSIEQCDGGEYFDCLFDHIEDLAPV